jgi:hypothetical protein
MYGPLNIKITLHLLYRRLGGKEGRSEWVRFITQTVQTVASLYTDYVVPTGCNLPVSRISKHQPSGLRQGIEHISLFGSVVCLRTTGHSSILGSQEKSANAVVMNA